MRHNQGHVMHSLSYVMHGIIKVTLLKPKVCLFKIQDFDKKLYNFGIYISKLQLISVLISIEYYPQV